MMEPVPALDAALGYLTRGWSVIPLKPSAKTPLVNWVEFQTRRASEAEVRLWFGRFPYANVGIVCGDISGILVLDIDPRNGGEESISQLERDGNLIPWPGMVVDTGGGGGHIYFTCPPGTHKSSGFRPGLDLQANGSYVVAPPSIHPTTGKSYILRAGTEGVTPLAPPEWLLNLAAAPKKAEATPVPEALQTLRNGVGEGRRNATAAQVAGYWLQTLGDTSEARKEVTTWNRRNTPPLEELELDTVWESVRKTNKRKGGSFHLTDTGNAERMVARLGNIFRYVPKWSKWIIWDGTRWEIDENAGISQLAKETTRGLYQETFHEEDEAFRKKITAHAMKSESDASRRNMLNLTKSEPGVPVEHNHLDVDIWSLNTKSGTVDLRTGGLRPHRPEDLFTKRVDVPFEMGAKAPRWEAFLAEVMSPHPEVIPYLKRVLGYSLTGSTREEAMFIFYGTGANGKSKFLETLRALLGVYCSQTPTETLLVKREWGIPNDVARLQGIRVVTAVETEDGKRLAEARVKALTGGDTITARFLHQEFFEFTPQFKLYLAVNHKPVIRGTDPGLWRRINLIPFEVTFPEDRRDRDLLEKLKAELPGILAWAVEGCLEWQKDGLKAPDTVKMATQSYKDEMDVVGDFIAECCVLYPNAISTAEELRRRYEEWGKANDGPKLTPRYLAARWAEHGAISKKGTGGVRVWQGIGLRVEGVQI